MTRALNRSEREKSCVACGKVFSKDPRNTWAYWGRAKYCSQACAGAATSASAASKRTTIEEQFARKFTRFGCEECWPWNGALDKDGYGVFYFGRKMWRAGVVAMNLAGHHVPKGKYACHTCDNPPCVNPDHLYPGTPTENMADARARGRLRVGERNPRAKLTEKDIIAIRSASGTHERIAHSYGVARVTITLIRQRKTWAHLL